MRYFVSKYNFYIPCQSDSDVSFLFNTRTSNLCAISKDHLAKLQALSVSEPQAFFQLDELTIPQKIVDILVENEFILTDDIDEIGLLKSILLSGRYEIQMVSLVIAPTMACNFSCTYCFEPKCARDQSSSKMSVEVQDAIIEYVKNQLAKYKISSIMVDWYGGEPTLALDVIERISLQLIKLAEEYSIPYKAHIVTNGYLLTPDVVDRLCALKITHPQITIDGLKEVHDKRRVLKSGKGTYDIIMKNLAYVVEKLGRVILRVNVDNSNYDAPINLYNELKEKGFFKNITFSLGNVFCEGSDSTAIDQIKFTDFFIDFLRDRGESIDWFVPKPKSNYCASDAVWAKMVGPSGELYRCWEEFGNSDKIVGNLLTKSLNQLHYKYITMLPFESKACINCNFLPVCMGGCPKFALNNLDKEKRMCDARKYLLHKIIMQYVQDQFSKGAMS